MKRAELEAFVSRDNDPCVMVDGDGVIVHANAVFHTTFGYPEVAGRRVSDIMPPRFIADHQHGFKRAMAAGYTRYRNGFSARLALIDGRGRERPITIPLLNVIDLDGTPAAIATLRPIPRWTSHWRPMAVAAAACAAVLLAAGVAYNSWHVDANAQRLAGTSQRLNRQLILIRGGILDLRGDLPDIIDGKITPSDLQKRLDLLYQQISELIVTNKRIETDVQQAIDATRDDS